MSSTWWDHACHPGGVPAKRVRMTSGEMGHNRQIIPDQPWRLGTGSDENEEQPWQVDLRNCPKVQGAADGKIKNEM